MSNNELNYRKRDLEFKLEKVKEDYWINKVGMM
jgi:hypothetical protein